uniref:Venom serpin-like protein 1 n=1 Tax=Pristhesancus plagipennis TaxID=1955184 RepID=A0A1Q1NPK3_PRIPG|nr:venom serpin-like protein 1 [Pristhesancus plagipennis]
MAYVKFVAFSLLGILLLTFTMPATTSTPLSPEDSKALEDVTEGSNKFAINLYQTLKKPNENIIVSPISVQIVLALAYSGAKSNTAKEIASVLHLPDNLDEVLKGHKLLIQSLENPVLKVANKMFIEKTLGVKSDFQKNALNYFSADAGQVDFIKNAEAARNLINNWVLEKTNDKIKDLLAPGVVDAFTRMVLVNAIHFKANWLKQFKPELTHDQDFHVSTTEKVKVKMMEMKSDFPFRYHRELDAKILELPYSGNEFKMVIILPNKIDGLNEVENKLATINLNEVLSGLHSVTVNVKIPKFKLESTIELKDILIKMGIKDIFDEGAADLSGISDERMYASKVIQKAFIEVNEEGTEAAAATVVGVESRSLLPREKEFNADHPFIYLLLKDRSPLFIGCFEKL